MPDSPTPPSPYPSPDNAAGKTAGASDPQTREHADADRTADIVLVAPSRRKVIFAGLMLAMVLAALDQSIVSTALPVIASDLGGLVHMTWVVTAFMLTSTISAPLYGKLSDMYGRRPLFAISIVLFLVASGLCGSAQTMMQLILFRGLQGLGAGGLMTLSQTVIGSIVTPTERGRYQGLFTGAFAVSSVAGPLLGGIITSHASWRWVFLINVPIGVVSLALVMSALPKGLRGGRHRIDYAGAALLSIGTAALLLLLNSGGAATEVASAHANAAMDALLSRIGLGLLAVLAFGLLLVVEHRAAEPILDLTLFRLPPYAISVAASGCMAFAMMGSLVFMPLYYQLVLGQTPAESGMMMLPQVIAMMISSVVGGRISSRTKRFTQLLALGVFLEFLGLALLATCAHFGAPVWAFLAVMALLGMGMGIGMPNATVVVQNAVPPTSLGAATASMSFVRSLGGSLGTALSGGVMAFALHQRLASLHLDVDVTTLLEHGISAMRALPVAQQHMLAHAYQGAIGTSLITGGFLMFIAFVMVFRLSRRSSA
ncbi:EmrB/QacA subfamily drug resistance transporter [Robbsia andropogonis]|uniref:MDR family MFS transporter n=1 Tax=Robbsia andropogonis TaxID=28092 RepID=UPI00209E278F|nr:MDR family MFS transporter [Robbsia andropogonis]MCP1117226.1 MFS transporter [Robbsia andropogonis]MCP1128572.1 MFS transporter [Robbsia andropogonis]